MSHYESGDHHIPYLHQSLQGDTVLSIQHFMGHTEQSNVKRARASSENQLVAKKTFITAAQFHWDQRLINIS